MNDYLSEVFGDGGLFASRFPDYEQREGQVALARMVDEAMSGGCHALGEGPCGTGKGQAYCVPAVWHAHHHKKRVAIATPNIALQEQLVGKDLPLLQQVVPWKFTFKLLKGRANFVCKDRLMLSIADRRGLVGQGPLQEQIDDVLIWATRTERGDVSELPFMPARQVWARFSVGSEECKRKGCRYLDACYYEREKAEAAAADIVVTNFHMLFAHLAIRRETGMDLVLPPFDFVILDEAHETADIAREFFGFTLSEITFSRLTKAAEDLGDAGLATTLADRAAMLFLAIEEFARSPQYKRRLRTPGFVSAARIEPLLRDLTAFAEKKARSARERAEIARASLDREAERIAEDAEATATSIARRSRGAALRLTEVIAQSDANKAYWIEIDDHNRVKLGAKPIDVGPILRTELFGGYSSVTLVSATLTTQGSFGFVREQLGVPDDAIEIIAKTPFDFESQALLVVPKMPDPREPEFVEAAARVFQRVIDACDGRTLGLFTSYKNLNAVYEKVDKERHRVLRQGERPRAELTRVFKEDIGSVLLGTESFWTGIDVAGEALTGLVIDKLPFPPPDDPVLDAICERDKNAFHNYLVPLAIIALRQGVGRLIRSKSDVGVVVILDKRIAEKGYGRRFLNSLPPMLTTRSVENITRFLEEAAYARAS